METKKQDEALSFIPLRNKLTVHDMQMKKGKEQIVMFCCTEPWLVAAAERAGVDIIRFPSWGHDSITRLNNTLSTIQQLRAVAPNILLNPFLEPHVVAESDESAIRWSTLAMGAGADIILALALTPQRVEALAKQRIPVFCHVGLTPAWYVEWTGGYVRVGKTAEDALKIYREAYDLQEAGAAMMTVEMTAREVTAEIAKRLRIPVLSIAGGAGADGAELLHADLLGISPAPIPKHAKQYRQFFNEAVAALGEYANDVKTLLYPDKEEHSWSMKKEEYERFLEGIEHIR